MYCHEKMPPGINRNAIYCSPKCKREIDRDRVRPAIPASTTILPNITGTIHELKVAIDLLEKGYEVYKALSSLAHCDLAILKNKQLLLVEVTTGYRTTKGKLHFPKKIRRGYDILAVVIRGEGIVYFPALPI